MRAFLILLVVANASVALAKDASAQSYPLATPPRDPSPPLVPGSSSSP